MRRYGEPPNRDQVYQDRPGAYAAIINGSDMLLTVENHPKGTPDDIQLPGGGIDPGESPLQALHREVMEETGYRIRVDRRLGVYQRYIYMPEYDTYARKLCHIFLARATVRHSAPLEPHHVPLWSHPADALSLLTSRADADFLARTFVN
jgi:8-oxo-dGTP diphosphatase